MFTQEERGVSIAPASTVLHAIKPKRRKLELITLYHLYHLTYLLSPISPRLLVFSNPIYMIYTPLSINNYTVTIPHGHHYPAKTSSPIYTYPLSLQIARAKEIKAQWLEQQAKNSKNQREYAEKAASGTIIGLGLVEKESEAS